MNLTPEGKTEVSNLIQSLLTQAQNELKLLGAKNQALTLELAHLRRIRYGAKSEALSQVQFSLFEEDWQTDVAAIEAEIEKLPLPAPQKPKRVSAGASRSRIICRASNTAMNRNPANANSAAAIW